MGGVSAEFKSSINSRPIELLIIWEYPNEVGGWLESGAGVSTNL